MIHLKEPLLTAVTLLAFMLQASSQRVTIDEIITIADRKEDAVISELLKQKGFEYNQSAGAAERNETDVSWVFRPFADKRELVSCFLIKVTDTLGNSKIILNLYNFYDYKDFVSDILHSQFRFNGVISRGKRNPFEGDKMEYKTYLHFRKKGMSFFTRESVSRIQYFMK
jgi:hypothetical protein